MRRIRSRPFIIGTALGAFAIAFFVEAPAIFSHAFSAQTDTIVLAGPPSLRLPAAELLRGDFTVVASVERLPQPVTTAFLDAHRHAAAAVGLTLDHGHVRVDVYPRDLAAFNDITFSSLAPLDFHVATGVPLARTRSLVRVDRRLHPLDTKFADSRSASMAHGVALGLVFILYLSIIIASQSVMASVAEEKTSRIAELLVATISPTDLLTGKTLAAATLALAQIAIWVATALFLFPGAASAVVSSSQGGGSAPAGMPVSAGVLVAFVAFFLIGFLQYATIYAAAASLISRTEDLGSVAMPVVLPAVAAFLIAQFTTVSPNAPLSVVVSFVPFLSPFVMFTRIAVATVPMWQIVVALALNALAAAACFYVAGKIYRVGMLLYGRLPSPRQIVAALRA